VIDFRAIAVPVLFLGTLASFCYSQDLPISRRVFMINPTLIEAATKVPAIPVAGGSGTVLVVFRTSEQGGVIDMRSTGGSPEMQRSSEAALSQWKFKPMLNGSGQPMEMFSAVIFDFSGGHPSVTIPKPMTAAQLSPALGFPCSNALVHQTPDAVSLCKKQLDAIVKDSMSSKMERFTAYDEYGVALLNSAQKPDLALQQFAQAIGIAPTGLKSSDAEWAYVYWHRAIAGSKTGADTQARQDFEAANESLKLAEAAVGTPNSAYYRQLEERLATNMQSSRP
jgi:hypothetical protein